MRRVCGTCLFAVGFESGPSPSGPEDGVNCNCEGMLDDLDDAYREEFKEHGNVNIFRIEVAVPGAECEHWKPKGD